MKTLVFILLLLLPFSASADNYYDANVIRVVDGDTFDLLIKLPLGIILKERVRVLDYDAPETWRPKNEQERIAGEVAKAKAKELLSQPFQVSIDGRGSFGRLLVNIKLEDGRDFVEVMSE